MKFVRGKRFLGLAVPGDFEASSSAVEYALILRRAYQRDDFSLIAAVVLEILPVDRDHAVSWMKLTHADEAEVREVRLPVCVSAGKFRELPEMLATIEIQHHQPLIEHRKHELCILKVKRRLREHRLACEQRFSNLLCD